MRSSLALSSESVMVLEIKLPNDIPSNSCFQVKWDFQSWLPLVSRILPSDVCRIHKKVCRIPNASK